MTYQAKHPAAFINVVAEDGTKAEAIEWLQRTWDELQDLRRESLERPSLETSPECSCGTTALLLHDVGCPCHALNRRVE